MTADQLSEIESVAHIICVTLMQLITDVILQGSRQTIKEYGAIRVHTAGHYHGTHGAKGFVVLEIGFE